MIIIMIQIEISTQAWKIGCQVLFDEVLLRSEGFENTCLYKMIYFYVILYESITNCKMKIGHLTNVLILSTI